MDRQESAPEKKRPPRWQRAFLKALSVTGNVLRASRAAKIDRDTAYNRRKADADFAAAWEVAMQEAMDRLEREAWRRAVKGTQRPVYQGGVLVGYVMDYSDTLLIFLLKGGRPEKFRENLRLSGDPANPVRHEHSGTVNAEHSLAPGAVRGFLSDMAAAGLGDVPANGEG